MPRNQMVIWEATQNDRTFEDGIGGGHVLHTVHGSSESSKSQSVVWTFKPAPHILLGIICFVKSILVGFAGMSEFRVKDSLSQITRALEALVQAIRIHQDPPFKVRGGNSYKCPKIDANPRVPTCFDSGLTIVSSWLLTNRLRANLASNSSTDFPVSKTEDRRLLANTSGDTSMNI